MEEFEAFVRARSVALLRTAYLLTGDRQLAEDLLQDTLTRLAQRWPTIVRQSEPEAYARRILYSRAVDTWRRRRSRATETLYATVRPDLRPTADDTENVSRRLILRDALARLAPRQRATLVLRFYEDRTEAETADVLGCSVNTVKSQTRQALARLRQLAPELADQFHPTQPVEAS